MTTSDDAPRWERMMGLLAESLDRPESERDEFIEEACGSDVELHGRLVSLLAASAVENSVLDAVPSTIALQALEELGSKPWIGRRLGAYRLSELIGSGGMGQVYRAERVDGQYEQQVAIKLMREGLDLDALLARFKAERQILANLDHPHLAKMLDGGITEEGIPYFVMEFVAGDPIDTYCKARNLGVDDRLCLFRTVCQVVHYAHRCGVVHRDLKPGNILVTHEGVVKLVDFGIAKQLTVQSVTATAQRRMTLNYASPEQVRGESVTPASDIFSLGVVLYHLLANTSPYPADTNDYELIKAICDIEPQPPSMRMDRLRSKLLRGNLDAVVMMALRKQPDRRYASAESLGDDIFRHLEGLPVQARRGAISYRAGRLLLRHKAVAGAVIFANLALIVGIGVAGYQAVQAQQQRARAEHHAQSVRRLANNFMFQVHDAIADLPGATPARKLLVQNSLKYLDELHGESSDDATLRQELATAYRKVGDIQGRAYTDNMGDPDGALRSYARGIELLDGMPGAATQRDLVNLYKRQAGVVLVMRGDSDLAMAAASRAIAIAQKLVDADPNDEADLLLLATSQGQRAQAMHAAEKMDDFVAEAKKAATLLRRILARNPSRHVAQIYLTSYYSQVGDHFLQRDTTPESAKLAYDAFSQSLPLLERASADKADDASLATLVASMGDNVGRSLISLNQPTQAKAQHLKALAIWDRLSTADPTNARDRVERAHCLGQLGAALIATGEVADARQRLQTAVEIFDGLPVGVQQESYPRYTHAANLYHLGRALQALGDKVTAKQRYEQSLAPLYALEKRFGAAPGNVGTQDVRTAIERVVAAR